MNKKWNQARAYHIKMAGKKDEEELIDVAQHLREAFGDHIKVQREWFIAWSPTGEFLYAQQNIPIGCKYRHPDIMVFEKLEGNRMGKLLCCIEIDGSVHDTRAFSETQKRNAEYEKAKVPLFVCTKSKEGTNIYADTYNYVRDILENAKQI